MVNGIQCVGLWVNTHRPAPVEAAARLIPWLRARGVECVLTTDMAQWVRGETGASEQAVLSTDLVLVLGGDGTALAAARALHGQGPPMLTVRFGSFGFLAEVEPEDIETALEGVLAGEYAVENRPMLHTTLQSEGETAQDEIAMNDVALVRGASPRLVKLDAGIDGEPLAMYSGDGVVVSTATGSTAYSLAAGGPIVHPTLDAFLVTPICPHALHFRPLLAPLDAVLTLRISDTDGQAQVSVDGQVTFPMAFGDVLTIQRAPGNGRFVTLGQTSFYEKVRTRLRWGERLL